MDGGVNPAADRSAYRVSVLDTERLRKVATAADDDGRPWLWGGKYPQRVLRVGDTLIVADCFEDPDSPSRFAEFIATFDPPTAIALVAEMERLRATVTAQQEALAAFAWAARAIVGDPEFNEPGTFEMLKGQKALIANALQSYEALAATERLEDG
jgi:hypothetical protein